MTEREWLNEPEPLVLVDWLFFDALASDRKLRLFSVACARSVVTYLQQFAPQAIRLLDLTEAFADREISPAVVIEHRERLSDQWRVYDDEQNRCYQENGGVIGSDADVSFWYVSQIGLRAVVFGSWSAEERDNPTSQYRQRGFNRERRNPRSFPFAAAAEALEAGVQAVEEDSEAARERTRAETKESQRVLLRDIFGNPFRPVTFSPDWRTDTVLALARQMYDSRDFSVMPILADALQDAGCDNEGILNHCRSEGVHVRGCWAIDLVLGKA